MTGREFQSLGRDSVGLDIPLRLLVVGPKPFQSLGRDSVGLDPQLGHLNRRLGAVSIPRSGFCWFGLFFVDLPQSEERGFNPSVGILLVWTVAQGRGRCHFTMFQSLGRDSVGLDFLRKEGGLMICQVSIPRSGFCWFGPRHAGHASCAILQVSIPRSGFCWFGHFSC